MTRSVAAVQSVEAFIEWRSQLERVGKVLRSIENHITQSWLSHAVPALLEEFAVYAEPFTVFADEVLERAIVRRVHVGALTANHLHTALELELERPLPMARDLAFAAQAFEREAQAHAFHATTRAMEEQVALGDCSDFEVRIDLGVSA